MRSQLTHLRRQPSSLLQSGITLIVALVLLVVISLTAAVTVRGSISSEQIANNARSQELAWQAAEGALRYYEIGVINTYKTTAPLTATLSVSDYTLTIAAAPVSSDPSWITTTTWDNSPTSAVTVPLYKLDDPSAASATSGISRTVAKFEGIYNRSPECIAQYAGSIVPSTKMVWVTCRGFGPEVPNTAGAPSGAEVFLQAFLDFN